MRSKGFIMSNKITYSEFCQHYNLDTISNDAKKEYEDYSSNLDLLNNTAINIATQTVIKKAHGGARKGAGRKALRGETVVKRFPERYIAAVNALIEHLDGALGKSATGTHVSEVNCRNLNNDLITLHFQSENRKAQM
ncbi:MAG: hypothetical protein ACJAVV_000796 [Alphaproteobacteria bacterium]|jgi:hypothetical protein